MKYLLLSCSLLAASLSTSPPAAGGRLTTASDTTKIVVYFSHHTTFTQLAAIRQSVLKDDIMLEYDQLAFDPSGHLTKISFHVEYKGEIWGHASEDNLTDDSFFGFSQDFTPGVAKPFRIGNLK